MSILAPGAPASKPAADTPRPSRPRRKWRSHSLPAAVALAAPAIRLVVVEGYAWEKPDGSIECGHQVFPVVAIRSAVMHEYRQSADRPERGAAPTHEGMESLGWHYDGSQVEDDALVYSDEFFALVPVSDAFGNCSNASHRMVPAPWPPEADEIRLASVVRVVEEEAVTKFVGGGGPR